MSGAALRGGVAAANRPIIPKDGQKATEVRNL